MQIKQTKKSFSGFTLAEALFLLYLSGIIAILYIATVKTLTSKEDFTKKWGKEYYAILSAQAIVKQELKEEAEDGEAEDLTITDEYIRKIESHLDVQDNCGDSVYVCGTNPPIAIGQASNNVYKTLAGGHLGEKDLYKNQVLLKDGANIFASENKILATSLWVDVNGYNNSPNKLGADLFGLIVTKKGMLPMGMKVTSANPLKPGSCSKNDEYIPLTYFDEASDYAGASCSYTRLFQN